MSEVLGPIARNNSESSVSHPVPSMGTFAPICRIMVDC